MAAASVVPIVTSFFPSASSNVAHAPPPVVHGHALYSPALLAHLQASFMSQLRAPPPPLDGTTTTAKHKRRSHIRAAGGGGGPRAQDPTDLVVRIPPSQASTSSKKASFKSTSSSMNTSHTSSEQMARMRVEGGPNSNLGSIPEAVSQRDSVSMRHDLYHRPERTPSQTHGKTSSRQNSFGYQQHLKLEDESTRSSGLSADFNTNAMLFGDIQMSAGPLPFHSQTHESVGSISSDVSPYTYTKYGSSLPRRYASSRGSGDFPSRTNSMLSATGRYPENSMSMVDSSQHGMLPEVEFTSGGLGRDSLVTPNLSPNPTMDHSGLDTSDFVVSWSFLK